MSTRGPRWIGVLLAASFVMNVVALGVPFLEMEVTLSGTETYSLPRSVELMWEAKLYAIAVLVVAFSVCFPFVKLFLLWRVWSGRIPGERAQSELRFVETWGKWSMLDVWIVCLLLGLTDDQFFVSTVPRAGLPCFLVAILSGMVAGEVLARRTLGAEPDAAGPRRRSVLVLAGLVHLAAILTPFLAVDSFWLADNEISIFGLVSALSRAGWSAWAPAVAVALFLVLAPLLWIGASWRGKSDWAARFERFAMLEVFAFALAVFLVEGDAFVPTELRGGAYCLLGAVGASLLLKRAAAGRRAAARG